MAEIFSAAFGAMSTFPDGVEMAHGGINESGFVGQYACLKITVGRGLHTHSCARQVCAAYVARCLVDNNDFEMHT